MTFEFLIVENRVKKSLLNSLRREFEVLEMKDTETITEYFAKVMVAANKMRSNEEDMPDSKVIEESKDIEAMSIDERQSSRWFMNRSLKEAAEMVNKHSRWKE